MNQEIISKYNFVKTIVIDEGYESEISWQSNLCFENLDEQCFLRELAWVVLSAGMRERIVRNLFGRISECFFDFESCKIIVKNKDRCYKRSIKYFNSPPKISAIINSASKINKIGFSELKCMIENNPIETLQEFEYIGPTTSYHLAKNLGLDVAKPDRHLVRIAKMEGYSDVQEFCRDISNLIGDSVPVIDIVFWRFATIERDYLKILSNLNTDIPQEMELKL